MGLFVEGFLGESRFWSGDGLGYVFRYVGFEDLRIFSGDVLEVGGFMVLRLDTWN